MRIRVPEPEADVPVCKDCGHPHFLHFESRCHNIVVTQPWITYPKGYYPEHDVPPCMCAREYPDNYEKFMKYYKKVHPDVTEANAHASYAHYKGHIKQVEKMQKDFT